ncbi:MFS transporter [Poseidonocella sedimentorum]|uniref:Glycoside/pentoside/hexuronide:cation symporter, GPH family n=1 Tax=Poseidonocella sedimentorum TaxID=871652 RepID=A0A1I6E942_9RHOB|nr:MFS transporter [Poseidonocella sedimentorum]SFR14072.1 glycoside/pentoside/hexuronide:cation symporter, GPH family [Poseidonocella sedimentorum]
MRAAAERLPAYAGFAAVLAAAGLPIYIHAPKVYADRFGLSFAALGLVLSALRLLDVVQDPALGWLSSRLGRWRGPGVAIALALMALSMVALFAVAPPVAPLAWFALCMAGLFTGYSFLSITFYARGVTKARGLGPGGHLRLAGWRETGGILGLCLAAVAPALLTGGAQPMAIYAAGFALAALLAGLAMRAEWAGPQAEAGDPGLRAILADALARRLLLIALANAAPVAITATLFLFFVETRLGAPAAAGPLLLLFFLSAGATAPLWARLAGRFGARRVLLWAMALAIVTFAGTLALGAGDLPWFALICFLSGAALGADMTLLPAIFAAHLARIAPQASLGFGLWSFVSKLTLALAAGFALPLLDWAGVSPGGSTSPPTSATGLGALSLLYAGVPCLLKLVAMGLLARTALPEARP